jgi:hypothetical protein
MTGAVVGFYFSPKKEEMNEKIKRTEDMENSLTGKWATVYTKESVYNGYVKHTNSSMILLGSVSKNGSEHSMDTMFLKRSSIVKIEINTPRINEPDIS